MRPWLCLVVVLAGCGPDHGGGGADCGVPTLSLEVRTPGGDYVPVATATDADLVLGFQGFRYIYLRGRMSAPPPERGGALISTLEGSAGDDAGAAMRSQPVGDLNFHAEGADWVSDPVRLFFNDDPLPTLVDHGCAVTLESGTRCQASAGGRVVLRYDPGCYEDPSGQRVCPDGGP